MHSLPVRRYLYNNRGSSTIIMVSIISQSWYRTRYKPGTILFRVLNFAFSSLSEVLEFGMLKQQLVALA